MPMNELHCLKKNLVCLWHKPTNIQIISQTFVLAWLPFIQNKMEQDYYHQKLNVQVVSRAAKLLKTSNLRK